MTTEKCLADPTNFHADNLDDWLEALEERAPYSPLAYYTSSQEDQQSLNAFCQHYFRASKQQRALIRSAVHNKKGVLNQLMACVHQAAERLQATKDTAWLEIGAAAAALLGGQLDYRDFLLALAELYVMAEEAGLDPDPVFEAVGGGIPSDFHTYAVVRRRRAR
jgi:hypothetical protein